MAAFLGSASTALSSSRFLAALRGGDPSSLGSQILAPGPLGYLVTCKGLISAVERKSDPCSLTYQQWRGTFSSPSHSLEPLWLTSLLRLGSAGASLRARSLRQHVRFGLPCFCSSWGTLPWELASRSPLAFHRMPVPRASGEWMTGFGTCNFSRTALSVFLAAPP